MISYSSGRARSSFAPARTVLFVNKENQKNFRRMLTHPQTAGGPNLCPRAGPTSRGREMLTHFNYQPLPCSLSARLRDSFYFGSLPKSLNRFFKRGARCNKRPPAVARTRLPGRCARRAFYCQPLPHVLCPRADGNLIQTRTTRLNDFLFQQSRAVELCPV